MIERTLARRYAAALLGVTEPEGSTSEAEATLRTLGGVYARDSSFRAVLAHPGLPRSSKKALFRAILGDRARPSLLRFLDLLTEKGRLDLLPELADVFRELADASRGIVRVRVRSWRPLPEHRLRQLEGRLARITGKRVEIRSETDASLGGGVCLRIGDRVIDGSVARRLQMLRERFREIQKEPIRV